MRRHDPWRVSDPIGSRPIVKLASWRALRERISGTRSLIVILAVPVAAVLVALWVAGSILNRSIEALHLSEADSEAQNVARALADSVNNNLHLVDTLLRGARQEYRAGGETAMTRWLEAQRYDRAMIDHLAVDDATGNLLFLAGRPLPQPVNVADRDYFRAQRDARDDALYVGAAAFGRATNRWLVRASLPLREGETFHGIVKAALDPFQLARLYESLSLGPNSLVALVGDDKVIRAHSGLGQDAYGTDDVMARLLKERETTTSGIFRHVAIAPVGARRYAYHALRDFPFAVLVGISETHVRDRLSMPRINLFLVVALASAALFGLWLLLVRQITMGERLAAADQAKADFLSRMSHELRTPLNAILGFSEAIKAEMHGPIGNRKYSEYARYVHESGKHLLRLVDGVLQVSKMQAGKVYLTEGVVCLRDLVDWTISVLRAEQDARQVHIAAYLDPDVDSLRADELALRQILLNLLNNSLKFTPPGGRIEISCRRRPGGTLRVTIADTGPGMTPQAIRDALIPFGQGTSLTVAPGHGAGLGLTIAKSLMELHGGSLTIKSVPRQGTRIILSFPASRVISLAPGLTEAFAPAGRAVNEP